MSNKYPFDLTDPAAWNWDRREGEVRLARTSDDPPLTAFHLGKAAGLAEAQAGKIDRTMRWAFDDYASGYCQGVAEFLDQ